MTYKELLDKVSFDEIAVFIHKFSYNLALYKTHYDMLRHLMPQQDPDDNKTVEIKYEKDGYEGAEPYLDAYPLEGDLWEVSLAKELIVQPDVKESWPEIAARCLWHTSFYGFTREQRNETFDKLNYYEQNLLDYDIVHIRAQKVARQLENIGSDIPSKKDFLKISSFRAAVRKRMPCAMPKRLKRKVARRRIANEYNKRLYNIGSFIVNAAPDETSQSDITLKELCELFRANRIQTYDYRSYAYNAAERAQWMLDLVRKYNAFHHGIFNNCVVCLSASSEHPLSEADRRVADYIFQMCAGRHQLILKTDDTLGEEMRLMVAFYEMA